MKLRWGWKLKMDCWSVFFVLFLATVMILKRRLPLAVPPLARITLSSWGLEWGGRGLISLRRLPGWGGWGQSLSRGLTVHVPRSPPSPSAHRAVWEWLRGALRVPGAPSRHLQIAEPQQLVFPQCVQEKLLSMCTLTWKGLGSIELLSRNKN